MSLSLILVLEPIPAVGALILFLSLVSTVLNSTISGQPGTPNRSGHW